MPKVSSTLSGTLPVPAGITRRAALGLAGGFVVTASLPGLANTPPAGLPNPKREALRYRIDYTGLPIGQQFLTFQKRGGSLRVDSRTIMKIGLGPLTAYEFVQQSRELWEGGRLTRLHAATEEDGQETIVSGIAVEEAFAVTVKGVREIYPANIFTNNDVWAPEVLSAPYLIDVRDGELLQQRVESLGSETIEIAGQSMKTRRFAVQGKRVTAELWYDDSLLLKATVTRDDNTVNYHLQEGALPEVVASGDRPPVSDAGGNR